MTPPYSYSRPLHSYLQKRGVNNGDYSVRVSYRNLLTHIRINKQSTHIRINKQSTQSHGNKDQHATTTSNLDLQDLPHVPGGAITNPLCCEFLWAPKLGYDPSHPMRLPGHGLFGSIWLMFILQSHSNLCPDSA